MKQLFFLLIFLALVNEAIAMETGPNENTYNQNDYEVCHSDLHNCELFLKNSHDNLVTLGCNKYLLALHSTFFLGAISNLPENANVIIDVNGILKHISFPVFLFAIRVMHDHASNKDKIFSSNEIKEYFDLITLHLNCHEKYFDKFFSYCTAVNPEEKIAIFELKQPLFHHDKYKKYVLDPFKDDIITHYPDANIVMDKWENFKRISSAGFQVLLEHDSFKTDSENTIFLIFRLWLDEQDNPNIKPLLSAMRFNHMKDYYLGRFVIPFLKEHQLSDLALNIAQDYLCKIKDGSKPRGQTYEGCDRKFCMKVEFRNINQWAVGQKYYSHQIVSNGYQFSLFVRVENETNFKSENKQYLGGYFHCETKDSDPNHHLQTKVKFEILQKNKQSRNLPQLSLTLKNSTESQGIRLSLPTENWEDIKKGTSQIVIDNKITIILQVEFI